MFWLVAFLRGWLPQLGPVSEQLIRAVELAVSESVAGDHSTGPDRCTLAGSGMPSAAECPSSTSLSAGQKDCGVRC